MHLVCLDLEGVLVPEIWLSVAEHTGIEALRLTTRDISDYNVLMKRRIAVLAENRITLADIQSIIGRIDPLDGALDFLDELRARTQVVILSDTFLQFAEPILRKLKRPTLFCNDLVVDDSGMIRNYRMRQQRGKKNAVLAFKSMGLRVAAAGDSYNDLEMLKAADFGALFRPPDTIKEANPCFPVHYSYDTLAGYLKETMGR